MDGVVSLGGWRLHRSTSEERHRSVDDAAAPRLTVKKTNMSTLAKLAHLGTGIGLSPIADLFDSVRRHLASTTDRRLRRPFQDIDGWSDQAEVAYYENCRLSRSA